MQLAQAVHQFFSYLKKFEQQFSPLDIAAERGNLELCKHIIGKMMKNNIPTERIGETAIFFAASRGHLRIVKFLIHNGFEKNPQDNSGYTLLHIVGRFGLFEVFRYIFDAIGNCTQW